MPAFNDLHELSVGEESLLNEFPSLAVCRPVCVNLVEPFPPKLSRYQLESESEDEAREYPVNKFLRLYCR